MATRHQTPGQIGSLSRGEQLGSRGFERLLPGHPQQDGGYLRGGLAAGRALQQRGRQRRGPLRRIARRRGAEPVRQPHCPRPAGDPTAEQPKREQHAADHAVAARYQARAESDQLLDRLDRARQVTAAAAGGEVRIVREVEVRREKYGLGAVAVKAAKKLKKR